MALLGIGWILTASTAPRGKRRSFERFIDIEVWRQVKLSA